MVCQVALFLLATGASMVPFNESAIEILDRLGTEGKFDSLFINKLAD